MRLSNGLWAYRRQNTSIKFDVICFAFISACCERRIVSCDKTIGSLDRDRVMAGSRYSPQRLNGR